jgi:HSP20 family protein
MATTELVKKEDQALAPSAERTREGLTFTPRVDILETQDELTLYMDLAGVAREDLDIQFERGELSIHGKVAPRHQGQYRLCEYGVGDFYRAFNIREQIDGDKIAAELRNGVLIVHLPKSEKVKPRKITVKTK